MHYAEFAEDEVRAAPTPNRPRARGTSSLNIPQSAALLAAIKEYEASKWKVIGQKVGKPAKVRFRLAVPGPVHQAVLAHFLTHPTGVRAVCEGTFRRQSIDSRRSIVS